MIKQFLEAGQVVGTHGVRGELRVNPWCDSPEFLCGFKTLYYGEDGSGAVKVKSCRPHGNIALVLLDSVSSVEDAAALRGSILYLRRSDANLPQGTHFISELIGCKVYDADDENIFYGTLADVSRTGANDVWHIKSPDGKEYLIPAIPLIVIETDVAADKITIRPIKGIFDNAD